MGEMLDPEELGVWQVLNDADPNDKLTAHDVASVATALTGRRLEEQTAQVILRELVRDGMAQRAGVRRTGRRTEQGYWLTGVGKRRAVKLLGAA